MVGQEWRVSGGLSLPGPWCPVHSEVSGWHCRSSAAGAAERHLWADRLPLCRRSLTETRQKGKTGMKGRRERKHKEHKRRDVRAHVCMRLLSICNTMNRGWPTAFVGRDSSFRFSSHSWSCFFTLFISDSCEVRHRKQRKCGLYSLLCDVYLRRKFQIVRTGWGTHRVVESVDPGWPWRQTGTVKLPLWWTTEAPLTFIQWLPKCIVSLPFPYCYYGHAHHGQKYMDTQTSYSYMTMTPGTNLYVEIPKVPQGWTHNMI